MNRHVGVVHSLIVFILGLMAALPSPCRADTVSGDVFGAWTADLGAVVMVADCRIPTGSTLIIGPGTRILMAPGVSLGVDGGLYVHGTPDQPVSFLPAAPLVGSWRSIAVSAGGTAELENCILQGGGAAQPTELMGALTVEGGSLMLSHCNIRASESNGVYLRTGSVTIDGTHFRDNGGARPTDAGLHVASGNVTFYPGPPFTSIVGSPFGVYNENLSLVAADGVWWGSATGPQHASNPGGIGISVSDDVFYAGFATVPPTPLPGDVNLDGVVDMRDVAALARIHAGIGAASTAEVRAGDIIPDGSLDLADAVALARVILTEGP